MYQTLGIVNSGCFIVKNSQWSRVFLEKWWSSYDRVQGMDQHIFTRVWEQVLDAEKHIKILRPDALNSHLPAWENQKDFNQILHLAGSSNVLRKLVFREGLQVICDHLHQESQRLPRQLGLTQQKLLEFEKNIPIGSVAHQIVTELKSKSGKQIPLSEIRKVNALFRIKCKNFHSYILNSWISFRWGSIDPTTQVSNRLSLKD